MKNIDELIRFEFTPECRDCEFHRDLGFLEFSCGFVIDLFRKEKFDKMKEVVFNYLNFDDGLSVVDPENIFFNDDGEWGVKLTFKTNLKKDKKLVLKELYNVLMDSMYFSNVNFVKNSLYYKDFNKCPEYLQSTIEEFNK